MPLQIQYATPSTGASAGYHVVSNVALDYGTTITTATVSSYLSKDAKDAGKFPMYAQQIQIAGLPERGVDARDFAETSLAAAIPTEANVSANSIRYTFSGAEIVD